MSPTDRQSLGALGPVFTPSLAGAPGVYITGEDQLRLRSMNSVAGVVLALEGRVLRVDGTISPISAPHTPNTDRTLATSLHAVAEGWVQNLSVRASAGTPRRGQCYVWVDLVRGQTGAVQPLGTVLKGYATDTSGLAWPGGVNDDPTEGRGCIRRVEGSNPAAGAEFLETVPTNARWRLLGVKVDLVTDATAANRELVLTLDDGANVLAEIPAGVNHTASQNRTYSFFIGAQRGAGATALVVNNALPDAMLMGGYRIQSETRNLQAGDDYGAPRLWVEEWIED
jgi:hypothetical protein